MLTRAINWVRARMRRRYWYAARVTRSQAWIVDARTHSTDVEFGQSQWWETAELCAADLDDSDIDRADITLVRLNAQPDTNHFSLKELSWPTPSQS